MISSGLVAVMLLVTLASCNRNAASLVEYGENVVSLMSEMLESENYISLYNLPASCDETLSDLREGDYSKAIAVYDLSIPESELLESFDANVDKESFPEELYKYVCSSAYTSFATRVNQKSGVEAVATSAAFSARKSFLNKEMNENRMYLYVFENGRPVLVTFTPGENGSFVAAGCFLISDALVTDNERSIAESCKTLGIKGVIVKKA